MPRQTLLALVCWPHQVPRIYLQHSRVSLATATPSERASPGAEGSLVDEEHLMCSLHLDH